MEEKARCACGVRKEVIKYIVWSCTHTVLYEVTQSIRNRGFYFRKEYRFLPRGGQRTGRGGGHYSHRRRSARLASRHHSRRSRLLRVLGYTARGHKSTLSRKHDQTRGQHSLYRLWGVFLRTQSPTRVVCGPGVTGHEDVGSQVNSSCFSAVRTTVLALRGTVGM